MPKSINPTCLQCASLTTAEARLLHGPDGDGLNCWDRDRCYGRRTDYRRRDRRKSLYRRKRAQQLDVPLPTRAAAYLYLYGLQQSRLAPGQAVSKRRSPHSLQAQLWIDGQLTFSTEPIHCDGLTSRQLDRYVKSILASFSDACGEELSAFSGVYERHERECPLNPCPLRM